MKVLITGASGFLGYNLCRDLKDRHLIYASQYQTPVTCSVEDSVQMDLTGSLKPVDTFIADRGIEAIIHCAAMSKASPCAAKPTLAQQINIDGTRGLAQIAAQHRIPFIFISTDLVYNSGFGPHSEENADPYLPYSESKFDAEMQTFLVHPQTVVLRCALIFGNDDGIHGSFIRDNENDLNNGKTLTLFTDQFRSPVWSRDIARAIDLILADRIQSNIFNLGGDRRLSRYDLGLLLAEIFNWNDDLIIPVSMEAITKNAKYLKDCSLDSSRLESMIQWKATPLETALKSVAAEWKL